MTLEATQSSDPVDGPDIHTTAGKLADLERRVDEAVHSGSARAVEKQHAKGKKPRASGSTRSSTRALSSNSTSSPGTARRNSAWRRIGPTAMA